jgi:hypothetical protein
MERRDPGRDRRYVRVVLARNDKPRCQAGPMRLKDWKKRSQDSTVGFACGRAPWLTA